MARRIKKVVSTLGICSLVTAFGLIGESGLGVAVADAGINEKTFLKNEYPIKISPEEALKLFKSGLECAIRDTVYNAIDIRTAIKVLAEKGISEEEKKGGMRYMKKE